MSQRWDRLAFAMAFSGATEEVPDEDRDLAISAIVRMRQREEQRRRLKEFTKKRYYAVRWKALQEIRKIGVEWKSGQLWWPKPSHYFQNKYGLRNHPERLFVYEGDNERVAFLNKVVELAWARYQAYC